MQLIAKMTKHGWFDGDKKVFVFRDILDEVGKFLRVSYVKSCACSANYYVILHALVILSHLIVVVVIVVIVVVVYSSLKAVFTFSYTVTILFCCKKSVNLIYKKSKLCMSGIFILEMLIIHLPWG